MPVQDSEYEHEYLKTRLAAWVFPGLATYFNWYNSRKTSRFLRGFCPKGRMSCMGRYRRNLLSFRETSNLLLYLALLAFLESGSMLVFSGDTSPLEPENVFFFHNSIWVLGFGLVIGLLLPHSVDQTVLLNLGSEAEKRDKASFYSGRPSKVLEPRRPPNVSQKLQQAGWLEKHRKKQHRRFVASLPTIEEIPRTLIY